MADLLKPKVVSITDIDGAAKDFIISRLPATVGREIVAQYPVNMLPKVGEYATNEAMMYKLLSYVAVKTGDVETRLSTTALVNNHCNDWEALAKLEAAMMEYNTSFFGKGKFSGFFKDTGQNLKAFLIQMLTELSAASSKPVKQPSTN